MPKILLVGGAGFVGEYLTKFLIQKANDSISLIHRFPLPKADVLPQVSYHQIDLTLFPRPDLREVIGQAETIVILTQPNQTIMKNLLTAAGKSSEIKKIVFLSTLLLYPESSSRQSEDNNPEPISVYEKNKLMEETVLQDFAKEQNLKLLIARLANVYGDIKSNGIIGKMFQAICKEKELVINGTGNQKRDYIFVEDAARFLTFLTIFEPATQKEIFNICTGFGCTINDLIALVEKITGRRMNFVNGPAVLEKQTIIGDNQKILDASGQKLHYDLRTGLKKTFENYLAKLALP